MHQNWLPIHQKCPRCGSLDIRRSSFRSSEERESHFLRSPYRCENCDERFWVLSRKAKYLVGMLVALIALAVIAILIPAETSQPQPRPKARAALGRPPILAPGARGVAVGARAKRAAEVTMSSTPTGAVHDAAASSRYLANDPAT
jgi:hypothetical protein